MRISRDDMLMGMAELVAQRGTCARLQVGAVFSKEGRVISTGYNGAPKGMPHCDHSEEMAYLAEPAKWVLPDADDVVVPEDMNRWHIPRGAIMQRDGGESQFRITFPGCEVAEHAERNAIAYAARFGVALDGCEVHVTHAPCLACARTVINAGIVRVTYKIPYRLTEGVDLLGLAGVEVVELA